MRFIHFDKVQFIDIHVHTDKSNSEIQFYFTGSDIPITKTFKDDYEMLEWVESNLPQKKFIQI